MLLAQDHNSGTIYCQASDSWTYHMQLIQTVTQDVAIWVEWAVYEARNNQRKPSQQSINQHKENVQ